MLGLSMIEIILALCLAKNLICFVETLGMELLEVTSVFT